MTDTRTRRQYLGTMGSLAFLGWGPLAENEDPEEVLEYDGVVPQFPDHLLNVRAEIAELEDYQPRLVVQSREARTDMQGMYGWSCESENHDQTAHYFWVRSHTQRSFLQHYFGIDVQFKDSHHKDHEPVIVFQNPDGTVDKIVCSGGHHLAIEIDGEFGHLIEDRVPDRRTHVVLRQMRPHNHFIEAPSTEDGGWVQGYSEFGSWLNRYRTWFRNDRYGKTSDVAVMDPFSFYNSDSGRTHWWREGTRDAWLAKHVYSTRISTDPLRYEE